VCAIHGGKSLAGVAAPNYQTGRHSKYLPARLLRRYHEAETDPRILELRDDIALIDTRLADLLQRVDTGESGAAWRDLHAAAEAGDGDAQRALITGAVGDEAAWADVLRAMDTRRRLVESERKRLVELRQMVPVADVLVLIDAITAAVHATVPDPAAVAAIAGEFARITGSVDADGGGPLIVGCNVRTTPPGER
jgi:hypothetical protein